MRLYNNRYNEREHTIYRPRGMAIFIQSSLRRLVRPILIAAVGLLILSFIVPLLNMSRFAEPLRNRLEATLGRSVQFEKVHFSIFSGFGFILENVTIGEDPHFGLEPFAFVDTLEAHLRPDKLLFGQLRFTTLRLLSPSLNVVKQDDGTWNVVRLIDRLAAPRSLPLTFLPTFEVVDGRVDLKLGTRKTTLYLNEADVSLYPERSGKLYIQFAGSPARSDRAGMGFGHLRGKINWYTQVHQPNENRLEGDLTLDPSNLSEITTLFEGYDLGVHGTVGAHLRIEGPERDLRVSGDLQVDDVHRWDLLPSRGEAWRIAYVGDVNLPDRTLRLETASSNTGEVPPVAVQVRANNFFGQPTWSVLARLRGAPAENLVPIGRRMGLAIPPGLELTGFIDGVVGYTQLNGVSGGVVIRNVNAQLPNLPPLRAESATATVSRESIHIDPTPIQTTFAGTLRAGADYFPGSERVLASIDAEKVPVVALKNALAAWFVSTSSGPTASTSSDTTSASSAFLDSLDDGLTTGHLEYRRQENVLPYWTGVLQLTDATAHVQGVGSKLEHLTGSLAFDDENLDLNRFSVSLTNHDLRGDYHWTRDSRAHDRLHLEVSSGDLGDIETLLDPTFRAGGLLARLHVSKRTIPPWLAARNLDLQLTIDDFSIEKTALGKLDTNVHWRGTSIGLEDLRLTMPSNPRSDQSTAFLSLRGAINLAGHTPAYRFIGSAANIFWRGGLLHANGQLTGSGFGDDAMQSLIASGSFQGKDLSLSDTDVFSEVSGDFALAFKEGAPQLRLNNVQATDEDEAWDGQAVSENDGRLIFDLQREGHVRRIVSTLDPELPATVSVPTAALSH